MFETQKRKRGRPRKPVLILPHDFVFKGLWLDPSMCQLSARITKRLCIANRATCPSCAGCTAKIMPLRRRRISC